MVGGYDHTLKKFAWGVVKATKKSIKRGLVSLFVAGILIAQPTLEHPVWTENHHDYIAAQDLKVGDTFLDGKGAILHLDSLAIKPDTTLTVYNFEVNDFHNYYVGTQEVLVHNTCVINAALCQSLSDLEAKLIADGLDPVIAKQRIIALKKSFIGSNITTTQRITLFNKVIELDLDKADFDRLITELSNPNTSPKVKQFLAKYADKGSLDVWAASKTWRNRTEVLEHMATMRLNVSTLNPVYQFIKNADGHIEIKAGSKLWATITESRVTASAGAITGNSPNDLNQVLNIYPLLKGVEYHVDNRFIYKTDASGNVTEMTDLDVQYGAGRKRSDTQQQAIQNYPNKGFKTGDNAGHIASKEGIGPSEQINYWALNGQSNQNGAWRDMEDYIKVNLKGDNPAATFEVVYKANLVGGRPSSISIQVKMNGNPVTLPLVHRNIPNP